MLDAVMMTRRLVQYIVTTLAAACAVSAAISAVGTVYPAGALASNPKLFVSADNTFFVYARGGEKISAAFTRSSQKEESGIPAEDVTVTLDGPGLAAQRCVLAKAVTVGQGCGFTNVVAPKTGVYRVQFKLPDTARIYAEVTPTVHWGANLFSWNISVADESGAKSGRVWSELYAIRQPAPADFLTDMVYYYVSESGFLYKATYKGYNGQISTLSADAFGIRAGDKCESAYQSVQVNSTTMSPSFGACGGSYKLFFEQPAGDLPQTAKRWDDKDEWVSPAISRPVVQGLAFQSDKNGDTQSGKITFSLKNFVGQYKVKIDVNDDGNYDATEDIKIARTMKKLDGGTQEITFNGIDGDGKAIPSSQRIGIKIQIEKIAEIHLVNGDVEGRTGGIEITRLNGDNAPTTRMCWDDTNLNALANAALMTKQPDGRNCPDSVGGVHGWPYVVAGGWGDTRYIDDWAYALAKIEGTAEIHYPDQAADQSVGQMRGGQGLVAAIIGGVVIIGIIVVIIAVTIRRQRRLQRLRQAQEQQIPPQYPGPGGPQPPFPGQYQ